MVTAIIELFCQTELKRSAHSIIAVLMATQIDMLTAYCLSVLSGLEPTRSTFLLLLYIYACYDDIHARHFSPFPISNVCGGYETVFLFFFSFLCIPSRFSSIHVLLVPRTSPRSWDVELLRLAHYGMRKVCGYRLRAPRVWPKLSSTWVLVLPPRGPKLCGRQYW